MPINNLRSTFFYILSLKSGNLRFYYAISKNIGLFDIIYNYGRISYILSIFSKLSNSVN